MYGINLCLYHYAMTNIFRVVIDKKNINKSRSIENESIEKVITFHILFNEQNVICQIIRISFKWKVANRDSDWWLAFNDFIGANRTNVPHSLNLIASLRAFVKYASVMNEFVS